MERLFKGGNKMYKLNVQYEEKKKTLLMEKANKIVQENEKDNQLYITWTKKDTSPNNILERWISSNGKYILIIGINQMDGKFGVRLNREVTK